MSFQQLKKQFLDESNIKDSSSLLRALNTLQVNISEAFQPLISKIQNDSTLIFNVSLRAGEINTVNHLLNKKLSGWSIVDLDSNSNIWRVNKTLNQNLTLYLQCSADCVVTLQVF